jgi:hypothetical protein
VVPQRITGGVADGRIAWVGAANRTRAEKLGAAFAGITW